MQRVSELVYGQILGAMATDGILYIVICFDVRKALQPVAGYCGNRGTAGDGRDLGILRT